jgi:hypothetical protein
MQFNSHGGYAGKKCFHIRIAWPSGQPWPLMGNVTIYEFTRSIGAVLLSM